MKESVDFTMTVPLQIVRDDDGYWVYLDAGGSKRINGKGKTKAAAMEAFGVEFKKYLGQLWW